MFYRGDAKAFDADMVFYKLMEFANLRGTFTKENYERLFGKITRESPWGADFWRGFLRSSTSATCL